jgi:hypothetical protein
MRAALIALAFTMGVASPVFAANARHPYQNVDRRVDQGGPTGDDQVERLNQQQLQGLGGTGAPMGGPGMPMNGPGSSMPR